MLTTDVQDEYKKLVVRLTFLCNQLDSALSGAFYDARDDGVGVEGYISHINGELDCLFEYPEDISKLQKEVSKNLRVFNRDSREYMYLKEFDALFGDVDKLSELICSEQVVQSFYTIGRRYENSHRIDRPITKLIEGIRFNCNLMKKSCIGASVMLRHSIFIVQNRAEFSNVIAYSDEGQKAKVPSTQPDQEPVPAEPGGKLQWNCSPAIAGYIISELVRAGYIEPPKTNGELSYAKLARICSQLFDIGSDGKPTTLDYLKKVVNPESNPLPDYKRAKLNLPDLDQLA